jgi:hypothetical protein
MSSQSTSDVQKEISLPAKERLKKLEDLYSLISHLTDTFNQDLLDGVLKHKQDYLEKIFIEELSNGNLSIAVGAKIFAKAVIQNEKSTFHFSMLKLFLKDAKDGLLNLIDLDEGKPKGGRTSNEIYFGFSCLVVDNYRSLHSGQYPSAPYLSKEVSKHIEDIGVSLRSSEAYGASQDLIAKVLEEIEKSEEKWRKRGTIFLPVKTADSYIKRMRLEEKQKKTCIN